MERLRDKRKDAQRDDEGDGDGDERGDEHVRVMVNSDKVKAATGSKPISVAEKRRAISLSTSL